MPHSIRRSCRPRLPFYCCCSSGCGRRSKLLKLASLNWGWELLWQSHPSGPRSAHWIHVLSIAFWETGAVGQSAPLHVGQPGNRREVVVWWFMDRWAEKYAARMTCWTPLAVRMFPAPSTASGHYGLTGALARKSAMVAQLFGTDPKTYLRNMEAVSVRVLLTRSGHSQGRRWCCWLHVDPCFALERS